MHKPIIKPEARVVDGRVELTWYKSPRLSEPEADEELSRWRILRMTEDDFVFGKDYEEYFLNLDAGEAVRIFEGALAPVSANTYRYCDSSVAIGHTYAYYVQTKNSAPIGPVPVKVRDPEVWWPYERLMARLRQIAGRWPGLVGLRPCGYTETGREIPRLEAGTGARVLGLVGAIHGGESGPELIVPAIEQLLADRRELLERVKIVAVPAVNIDAREKLVRGTPWYLRTTLGGTDINRNFPADWATVDYRYGLDSSAPGSPTYRGPRPASAPETQAVMAAFADVRPDIVLSYHAGGLPALATQKAENDPAYGERCRKIVALLGQGLYPEMTPADNWLRFTTTAGSLSTWLYALEKIPTLDLELRPEMPGRDRLVFDQADADLQADYQRRHARALATLVEAWASEDI